VSKYCVEAHGLEGSQGTHIKVSIWWSCPYEHHKGDVIRGGNYTLLGGPIC